MISDKTLDRLWSQAVRLKANGRCRYCHRALVEEPDPHHLGHCRNKYARWLLIVGIPVAHECHIKLHTDPDAQAWEKRQFGELIQRVKNVNYKQYLIDHGMTDEDFRAMRKAELEEYIEIHGGF